MTENPTNEFTEKLESRPIDDGVIPIIDATMLAVEVDFEKGMNPWPPISILLSLICIIAFGFEVWGGGLDKIDKLIDLGALSPPHVQRGEVWRTVSAAFLHGGADHLIGNLVMLYILGMACEHGFGCSQFLFLYVAAAICGSLLSMTGGRVSVGASGAIFGLAGALIVLFWWNHRELRLRDRRIGVVVAVWAAYQLILGAINPGVDNLAHFGGFAGGAVLGWLLQPAVLRDRKQIDHHPVALALFGTSCIVLMGTAIAFLPRLVR